MTLDGKEAENPCIVVVRLTTSYFQTKRGISFLRKLDYLQRQCVGDNFVEEDVAAVGIDETLSRITNLHDAKDGVYKILMVNLRRDWETGNIEDYDFLLVPVEQKPFIKANQPSSLNGVR